VSKETYCSVKLGYPLVAVHLEVAGKSGLREHVLHKETLYTERTHATYIKHILSRENRF
jgi:hypothetical protein